MSKLVKVNASDYGIESTKAKEIEAMFSPMLEKMKELEAEYNDIVQQPITEQLCAEARLLRLEYVKVRTGTAKIHKEMKDFYLRGGRLVDGWKNAQLAASQEIEAVLAKIERHYEILEQERKEALKAKREALLQPFTDILPAGLDTMANDVFENYLTGVKVAHQARIEAEKKAEKERQEQERKDKLHAQRKESILHLWNYLSENQQVLHFGSLTPDEWAVLVDGANQRKKAYEKEQEQLRIEKERLQKEAREREKQIEEERKEALKAKREALLQPFTDILPAGLDTMANDVFENYLTGVKVAHQARIEAEKKAEKERQEQERKDKLHAQRKESILHLWNYLSENQQVLHFGSLTPDEWAVLVDGANQRKKAYEKEQEQLRIEKERLQKEAREREKQIEEERKKARIERDKREYELSLERKRIADLEAKQAAEEKARQEAIEKAKKKAEAERKAKEAEERKLRLAPDKEKLFKLADDLDAFTMPELKTPETDVILNNINILIAKTTAYIREKANSL
ncbi:MAG: hypothetical protein RBT61_00500 [Candidatus Kapabacteria bacterium]|jgi:hypothetical protein|nr:hypothetical protein [Candidatus Kapabacteria bacterium]